MDERVRRELLSRPHRGVAGKLVLGIFLREILPDFLRVVFFLEFEHGAGAVEIGGDLIRAVGVHLAEGFDLLQGYAFGRPQALDSILSVGGTDPGQQT